MSEHLDIQWYEWRPDPRRGEYQSVSIRAGRKTTKRIVPPAGEAHAFDVPVWDHRIDISVSPTGRSVQVYVDGEQVL